MINTLPKTAHHQIICEANYIRLKKILCGFNKTNYKFNLKCKMT